MKKVLLVLVALSCLTACLEYEMFPLRPVSFEIDGKTYYSAKDTEIDATMVNAHMSPVVMDIARQGDSLSISYFRRTDFINYDIEKLCLNIKSAATFEKNKKIEFAANNLVVPTFAWSSVSYVALRPVQSSSAADSDLYLATEGWIEFTEISSKDQTVAGKFEFKAVLNDQTECLHLKEIVVKNGTFSNIPYSFSEQ